MSSSKMQVSQQATNRSQYNQTNSQRPGGNTSTVSIIPSNPSITQTYRILGDQSSVQTVLLAIETQCPTNVSDNIVTFAGFDSDTLSNATLPKPEQVVQWYRGSSFALSLDGYTNTASLPSQMPPNSTNIALIPALSADTPLPSDINIDFLTCLNSTIGRTLPLVDRKPFVLSNGATIGIIFGLVIGLFPLVVWCCVGCPCGCSRRRNRYNPGSYDLGRC
jgi:hypothetical protein